MSESPAFQIYPNDFLGSAKVGMMSTEEIGAYWLLLLLDWQEGGFVFEERSLSRWCKLTLARFRKAWEAIRPCFVERDGRLFNPRLEKEREKQAEWRRKSSEGGKKSAETRWGQPSKGGGKGGYEMVVTNGVTNEQPIGNTPLPLPSPVTAETTTTQNGTEKAPPEKRIPAVPKPKSGHRLTPTPEEAEVLEYHHSRHPRRGPYDDPQVRKVRTGLVSFTVPQMKLAVDGNLLDEWSVERHKHEISWIFRDNDKISENIDRATAGEVVLVGDDYKLTEAGQRFFARPQ